MARELSLEVGNFVCNFGDTGGLLSKLEEIVIPAFFNDDVRTYGSTTYTFTKPSLAFLSGTEGDYESLALCCRFVKNTTLSRRQVLRNDEIVEDEQTMESAPSSLAALLLGSHRLLFVRETPHAPEMSQFGTTFKYKLRNATIEYIDTLYTAARDDGKRVTKKRLREIVPVPEVQVVPVVSKDSLHEFILGYQSLRKMELILAPTNSERDGAKLYQALRNAQKQTGADSTTITHRDKSGLDLEACYEQAQAAKQGNAFIKLDGTDEYGARRKGDEEHFSVNLPLGVERTSLEDGLKLAYSGFIRLLAAGSIAVGETDKDPAGLLMKAYQTYVNPEAASQIGEDESETPDESGQ